MTEDEIADALLTDVEAGCFCNCSRLPFPSLASGCADASGEAGLLGGGEGDREAIRLRGGT